MTESEPLKKTQKKPRVRKGKNPSSDLAKDISSQEFPIVGIGCSAGGLEALEGFLSHVPAGSGMAYIIIQHLDPDHQGILTELLQRKTTMPVTQVKDRMKVQPDSVYVIPPNKDMSLLHGTLHLFTPVSPRGLHLPIDLFFRSLAEDRKERAIGVILSGMGTDGTLGLTAIKEKAGVVFVQDPVTAKFTGMPNSAINSGLADVIAPVDELPEAILGYSQHAPLIGITSSTIEKQETGALEKIIIIIRTRTGHDFSQYKRSTLYRRIERRMGIHKIEKIAGYVTYLQENPLEIDLLFKELLIGVTNFFRDHESWDQLKTEVISLLNQKNTYNIPLRAWVPGCSTGEEAYSLAIVIHEVLDEIKSLHEDVIPSFQIYATDIDPVAIEKARIGFFPHNIVADITQERLSRFFIREDTGYRIGKEIREGIVFATQNLIMDPPFTKLDIISCRNLLIYFSSDLQKKLIPLFHYSLKPEGILFLGSAETISGFGDLFSPLNAKSRIFHRNETLLQTIPVEFPTTITTAFSVQREKMQPISTSMNFETHIQQVLLEQYTSPAVLANDAGDILYINGKTGKYLEMSAGKAIMNIYAMAREGLQYELSTAFTKVVREGGKIFIPGITVGTNGGQQRIDLTVQSMNMVDTLKGTVLIVFDDIPTPVKKRSQKKISFNELECLEQENQHQREALSTLREEMQTSQEELRSTNEELQSTNEELQSTNEELTTSKEEMQSLNEELQTVNTELQSRVEDLSRANNDMKNLLNSTDIATIFLDNDLKVRRFTTQAKTIIKFIESDVGRPITDLASSLEYPDLINDASDVLRTLVFCEKMIHSDDGRWFTVRIMPYRTVDNRIDGLVITFIDVTKAKIAEEKNS